jgi:hypothetical protein
MLFEFLLHRHLEFTVEIVREFADNAFAVQLVPPCRK